MRGGAATTWTGLLRRGYRALPPGWQEPAREAYDAVSVRATAVAERRRLFSSERILFVELEIADLAPYTALAPGADEVLIDVQYTAVSVGTELATFQGLLPRSFPYWPGYSGAGVVSATGSAVRTLQPGDRVAGQVKHAARVITQADRVFKLGPRTSLRQAAFHQLCFISLGGIRRSAIRPGTSVAVIGQGIVGQLASRFARIAGAVPLAAVAPTRRRQNVSLAPGGSDNFFLLDEAPRDSFDVVIESSGASGSVRLACELAAPAGTVVLLGGYRAPERAFPAEALWQEKHLRVVGAHMSAAPDIDPRASLRPHRAEGAVIAELLDDGVLDLEPIITHCLPASQANRVYEELASDVLAPVGLLFSWRGASSEEQTAA